MIKYSLTFFSLFELYFLFLYFQKWYEIISQTLRNDERKWTIPQDHQQSLTDLGNFILTTEIHFFLMGVQDGFPLSA